MPLALDPATDPNAGVPDPNNPGYDLSGNPLPRQGINQPGATTPSTAGGSQQNPYDFAPTTTPTGSTTSGGAGPTDWLGLQQQIFGSQPSVGAATPPPFQYDPFNAPAPFSAPNGQDVLDADPGYQFRLDQGTGALQNSAAARGVLNTGGTLQDLINYGQGAASQEYGNAYDRALGTYQTNYQDALNSYITNFGNALTKYNTNYNTQYLTPFNQLQNQYGVGMQGQNQLFGQQFSTATA
jgi:hypothetical protein